MNIAKTILNMLIFIIGIATAEAQTEEPPKNIPHEVLAFYYPWYGLSKSGDSGNHWGKIDVRGQKTASTTHFPQRGAYSSQNAAVVDAQIAEARSNGITGFIVSWWGKGTYEDKNLPLVLARAEAAGFKVSAYWEKEPGKGEAQIEHAVDDLSYLVTQFGGSSAFLKVGGKPVIFVYERTVSEIPESAWPGIISRARAKAGPFLLMDDKYEEKHAKLFNGVSRYNISWAVAGKSVPAIRAWAAKFDGETVNIARRYGWISCATVIPGYDDSKVRKPGRIADRQEGQVYRTLWEEAIRAKPDWVVITSWNEWHEGTEIEPSVEDADKYLKLTAEYAREFMGAKK